MMSLLRAIKARVMGPSMPPFRFPDHIERVHLNPRLLLLHMENALTPNPAVDVSGLGTKRIL